VLYFGIVTLRLSALRHVSSRISCDVFRHVSGLLDSLRISRRGCVLVPFIAASHADLFVGAAQNCDESLFKFRRVDQLHTASELCQRIDVLVYARSHTSVNLFYGHSYDGVAFNNQNKTLKTSINNGAHMTSIDRRRRLGCFPLRRQAYRAVSVGVFIHEENAAS